MSNKQIKILNVLQSLYRLDGTEEVQDECFPDSREELYMLESEGLVLYDEYKYHKVTLTQKGQTLCVPFLLEV